MAWNWTTGRLSVTKFWRDAGEDAWFEKNDAFDADFRDRFLDLHYAAARRECDDWSEHAEGSLALMILLDQFPRNCFRGTGHMYATDPLAQHFAKRRSRPAMTWRSNRKSACSSICRSNIRKILPTRTFRSNCTPPRPSST